MMEADQLAAISYPEVPFSALTTPSSCHPIFEDEVGDSPISARPCPSGKGMQGIVRLRLCNRETTHIAIEHIDDSLGCRHFFLRCYSRIGQLIYRIALKGAVMTRTISEVGPCIYLHARELHLEKENGLAYNNCTPARNFEFQFKSHDEWFQWMTTFTTLGTTFIDASMLFEMDPHPIGSGRFAEVYAATLSATGEEVAIKKVTKSLLAKNIKPSAVQVEIELLRCIDHCWILQFYTAYEDEDYYYLVLERLRGPNLQKFVSEKGPLPESVVKIIMFKLLGVLVDFAAMDLIHRDLKTENIVLEDEDDPSSVKVIDFGLAVVAGLHKMEQRLKMNCGSPGYVAPEIIKAVTKDGIAVPYSSKADVFSAGAVMYYLLSGATAFNGSTEQEMLSSNYSCAIKTEAPIWNSVSPQAKAFMRLLLTRNANGRPTAREALKHPWFYSTKNGGKLHFAHNIIFGEPRRPRPHPLVVSDVTRATLFGSSSISPAEYLPSPVCASMMSPGLLPRSPSALSASTTCSLSGPLSFCSSDSSLLPGSSDSSEMKAGTTRALRGSIHGAGRPSFGNVRAACRSPASLGLEDGLTTLMYLPHECQHHALDHRHHAGFVECLARSYSHGSP